MAGSFGFWNTKETYKPIVEEKISYKKVVVRNDYEKFLLSMKLYKEWIRRLYTSELLYIEDRYVNKLYGKKEIVNAYYKQIKLKNDKGIIRQI